MLEERSPEVVQQQLAAGSIRLVDIREPDEIRNTSIPGAIPIPLSLIDCYPLDKTDPRPVVFTCQSGRRTRHNATRLAALAGGTAFQMEGGVTAWAKAGYPTQHTATVLPLFRQIQIGAGGLAFLGAAGSFVWAPLIWLAVFAGAGLLFAGITGFCGLGLLLARMPWNRPAAKPASGLQL